MISVSDQTSLSAQANLSLAQGRQIAAPTSPATADIKKSAEKFVGMFMSQMFSQMYSGVGVNKMFGGGQGEEMFKSVLMDEYGKAAAKQGGMGLTDKIMHALIAQQEKQS